MNKIVKKILNGTYKPHWRDFKYFTPDFIRQINTKFDIEYMLFGYLSHTPFKEVDINILREWKQYHYDMFL